VRALLLFLAQREGFKNFILKFGFFQKAVSRFVSGETLDDAIRAVREANSRGIRGTLDFLGENTLSRDDAVRSAREAIAMLERIEAEKVECNVSVKLTQLGLDLGREFCCENLLQIVRNARERGIFVRVDMEDHNYTDRTLDLVLRAHRESDNVGIVVQSCLYRAEKDVLRLLENGIRVRLCKGAYLEPESVAFRKKSDTDANFVKIAKLLLDSGLSHAIATHDERMITAARQYADERKIEKGRFEFQMLHGVRRDLQLALAQGGYNVRIYIPYGTRWYPYFMRRLAERPANVFFILKNLFIG